MNRQTRMNTPPAIQKVNRIVSSIPPQLDAISVHHHGVTKWNTTEPMTTAKNMNPGCIGNLYKRKIT
jgi:hypothetical protein